ncbi:MAG: response regulator [Proteobacteria bacterium]|nr:response regulator [Pseudomonadota bacterium]
MTEPRPRIGIIIADDDADDRLLITEALEQVSRIKVVRTVGDGQELMDLLNSGELGEGSQDLPYLVLLDLNMPRKDGREALAEIRANPQIKCIPVVILSTSQSPQDVRTSYGLGANAYLCKPASFEKLVATMKSVADFWGNMAVLPKPEKKCRELAP